MAPLLLSLKRTSNGSSGSWSSDGCTLLDESSTERTICSCNHLTNFAVLMQYKPVQVNIS